MKISNWFRKSKGFKTGKLAAKHDPQGRTLKMAKYMTLVPDPPEAFIPFDLNKVAELFPLDGNSQYGDCVVAGAAHYVTNEHLRVNEILIPKENEVVKVYRKLTGCKDNGLVMMDFLKYWRKKPLFNHQIELFGRVDFKNQKLVKQCIYFFGGVDLGFMVQNDAIKDFESGTPWTPGPDDGGGHCVILAAYDKDYVYVLTWGGIIKATWNWLYEMTDEAFVILPPEYKQPGFAPGFDSVQLEKDFASITN